MKGFSCMPAEPLLCRYCGRANPSSTALCVHCNRLLVGSRVLSRNVTLKGRNSGITRRTVLFGIAGAAGALALGCGVGIWYTSRLARLPKPLIYAGHRGAPIAAPVWLPDGNFLAAVHSDGTVQIWQAQLSSLPPLWRNI